jgi:hypothetical protein
MKEASCPNAHLEEVNRCSMRPPRRLLGVRIQRAKELIKMEPVTIAIAIKIILAKAAAAKVGTTLLAMTVLAVVLLTFEEIVNWFTDRQALKESDKDNLAFTLHEKLATGQYNTVQGIFNKRTQTIPAACTIKSQRVDAKLAAIHAIQELALYS